MCPRSSQQVAKLDITHVQVLSSYLTVQDTARDISALWSTAGPIGSRRSGLSKRLLPAAPATAVPWAVRSVSDDASEGVRFLSPGLLQLSVLRHLRRTDESAAFRNNLFTYLLTYWGWVAPNVDISLQNGRFWDATFIQREVIGFQVLVDSLHPCSTRALYKFINYRQVYLWTVRYSNSFRWHNRLLLL